MMYSYSTNTSSNAYNSESTFRAPSEKQINAYIQVCARKKLTPVNFSAMSQAQFSKVLQSAIEAPMCVSEKQITMIRDLCAELVESHIPGVKMPSQKFYDSLNLETASKCIEKLNEIKRTNFDKLRPSQQQLESIVAMWLCPEVDFPKYGVVGRVYTSTLNAFTTDEVVVEMDGFRYTQNRKIKGSAIGESNYRMATPDELAEEVKRKMTHADASKFLSEYSGAFTAWRRTLATEGQKKAIRELEQKLSSIYVPREVVQFTVDTPFQEEDVLPIDENALIVDEMPIEDDGALVSDESPFEVTTTSKKFSNWNPNAYVGLSIEELSMMTRDGANAWIKRLELELYAKTHINRVNEESGENDSTFESIRVAKTQTEWKTQEYKVINNLLYALQDMTGVAVEELQNDAVQVFFKYDLRKGGTGGGDVNHVDTLKTKIKELIFDAIERKYVPFNTLLHITEKSEIAQEILDELENDTAFAVALLKSQRRSF